MEDVHDKAHVNQGYFLSDGFYSICSPIFFVYHGFIDLLL